jgi:Protein of unknown function (DUF3429)
MNSHFFNKRMAHILGALALLPFAGLSFSAWIMPSDWQGFFVRSQIGYGIAILSFLGGIHWGGALGATHLTVPQTKKALIWGLVPSLIAFSSLLVETNFAFGVLSLGFIVSYQFDKYLYQWYKMPNWLLRMRFKLSCIVMLALLTTFLAIIFRTH